MIVTAGPPARPGSGAAAAAATAALYQASAAFPKRRREERNRIISDPRSPESERAPIADTPVRADHDRTPIADTPARASAPTNAMARQKLSKIPSHSLGTCRSFYSSSVAFANTTLHSPSRFHERDHRPPRPCLRISLNFHRRDTAGRRLSRRLSESADPASPQPRPPPRCQDRPRTVPGPPLPFLIDPRSPARSPAGGHGSAPARTTSKRRLAVRRHGVPVPCPRPPSHPRHGPLPARPTRPRAPRPRRPRRRPSRASHAPSPARRGTRNVTLPHRPDAPSPSHRVHGPGHS